MGGKKKYIIIFGSFTEPFNFFCIYSSCHTSQPFLKHWFNLHRKGSLDILISDCVNIYVSSSSVFNKYLKSTATSQSSSSSSSSDTTWNHNTLCKATIGGDLHGHHP